jgi:acetyltransferase-like isoleucine patch superfamily enzyme
VITMGVLEQVRTARTAWALRVCESVGEDAHLHGWPTLYASPGHIRIGKRFRLWSRPIESHLSAGPDGTLEIGDDVSIAHGAAISAYEHVQIGDGTCLGPFALIMDTNFHGRTGDQSVQHDTRPVIIGKDCRIGSAVTITRGAVIGDGSEILAGSVVSSAIPAGVCAGGARARVLGLAGDPACRWDGAAALLPDLVKNALNLETAPDLAADTARLAPWDGPHIQRLVEAVEKQFALRMDAAVIRSAVRLVDIAVLIERGRTRRF